MKYQNSVVTLILHKGQILLQHNPKWGDYSFIGGKLEENETPLEAAYREVEEELSLKRQVDFYLEAYHPNVIELEKISKRTKELTHYRFYLFFLIAKQNFLNQIQSEKNIWLPVSEIQTGKSNFKVSELVSNVLLQIELKHQDSLKDIT